jgi:type IV secretory pathway VirB10-like protein
MSERALLRILFAITFAGAVVIGVALWMLGTTDEHRTPRQSGETSWTTVPDDSAETMSPQPAPLVIPTTYPPRPAVDVPSRAASSAAKLAERITRKPTPRSTSRKPKPHATTHAAVRYANCTEVKRAGAAPIHPGDPGWQAEFDRDGDGVGCDS